MYHFPASFVAECTPDCVEYKAAPIPVEPGEIFLCETHMQWWLSRLTESGALEWLDIDFVPWSLWRDIGYLTPPS